MSFSRMFAAVLTALVCAATAKADGYGSSKMDWSGFYAGINGGGAWAKSDTRTRTTFDSSGYFASPSVDAIGTAGRLNGDNDGLTGGAQAGFNWQDGNAVFGIETDLEATDIDITESSGPVPYPCCGDSFTVMSRVKSDWLATVRPRIGFASDGWLFYGTGGLAVGNLDARWRFSDTATASESASRSSTKAGWTVGAGAETMLPGGWSLKAEYLYVDLGDIKRSSDDLTTTSLPVAYPENPFDHRADLTENIARIGLNYHF